MGVSILVQHNYRNKVNQNGRYPVHLYVKPEGEREKLYPIKLPQNPTTGEWQDKPDVWVKTNSHYTFQSNQAIRDHKQKIIDLHKRLTDQQVAFTHYHISKELV